MKEYIPKQYWEELLSKDFSLSGVGYQGLGRSYNKWLYKSRKRIMDWFLKKYPLDIENTNILDIGCGTGFYVALWKNMGVKYLSGLDLTEKSITELSTKYKCYKFIVGDIGDNKLIFDDKFDLITAFDTLFHVVDEDRFEQAIHNIGLLSKTGAIILISDNFLKKPRPSIFNQAHRTFAEYEKVLNKNGIKVLELKPIFYIMNGPIDISNDWLFRLFRFFWHTIMYVTGKSETLGEIIGRTFYIVDGILIKLFKDSITTELLICKKQ